VTTDESSVTRTYLVDAITTTPSGSGTHGYRYIAAGGWPR